MTKTTRIIVAAILGAVLMTSCGVNSYLTQNTNVNQTNVVLSQNNFRILGESTGRASATYIFGIGGLSKKAVEGNATADMIKNANLKGSQAIINQTATESVQMIAPFFERHTITVKGTIIEFRYRCSPFPSVNISRRRINMKHVISRVWIDAGQIYARTTDGLLASYPVAMWKRLASATEAQLNDFYLSYSGIHWPLLDEDLSFEGMFHSAGLCKRTNSEDSVCFLSESC